MLLLRCLFHLFQQSGWGIEVARIGVYVEHLSVAVDDLVGRPAMDLQEMLYGTLLVGGQVVVDDVLPRLVAAAGCQR